MQKNKDIPGKINRRDTLKSLLIGGVAITTFSHCNKSNDGSSVEVTSPETISYGRTQEEKIHDQKILTQPSFFTDHEAETLSLLVDIIVPIDDKSGSANDSGVMEFLEFIVKDMDDHQMPLRQGLAWLDRKSKDSFENTFIKLSNAQQEEILDLIAYPEEVNPENIPGEKFFSKLRDLTLTGFYTSKIGIEDLGYVGNRPNFWDGIPKDVLDEHGMAYDDQYLQIYVTNEGRTKTAQWDDEGNLMK